MWITHTPFCTFPSRAFFSDLPGQGSSMSEPPTFLHVNCCSFRSVCLSPGSAEIKLLLRVYFWFHLFLFVKQGTSMFLQFARIVMGEGERKTACYWLLCVHQVPSHVLSFMLPCDDVGQSVLSFCRLEKWGWQWLLGISSSGAHPSSCLHGVQVTEGDLACQLLPTPIEEARMTWGGA